METTPKKSMLEAAMAPFIEGLQHSYSSIAGDLSTKGLVGTGKALFNNVIDSRALGANPIGVPAIDSRMFGKLPAVTPTSSFLEHPAVQQGMGDVGQTVGNIITDARSGDGPREGGYGITGRKGPPSQ